MRTENGSYVNRWKGIFVLSFALLMVSLDNTVLNVAIPTISLDLGASASDLQWIVDIYVLFFAALLLTIGSLSDRFGRRLSLNLGMTIFGLGSLGAALSTSTEMLIAMRAVTGIGAAAMMPSTLSILTDMFRDPQERMKAIGVWGMTFGLGFGFGPVLGGWIVDDFSWQMVFYINIPVAIITVIMAFVYLPESKDENVAKADFIGMFLSIIGLFALVYAIIQAGVSGWGDATVVKFFILAFVVLTIFIVWELKHQHPMLPLALFKNPSFIVASLSVTLVMFGMMGTMYFYSQYFQTVQQFTALQAGMLLIPLTIGMMIASGLSPKLTLKFGLNKVVTVGMFLASISMLYFALLTEVDTPVWVLAVGQLIQGVGVGLGMMPSSDSIMGAIPKSKLGTGSAMNDTTRELGGALSVAVMGTVMNASYIESTSSLKEPLALAHLPTQFMDGITSSIQGAHVIAGKLGDAPIAKEIISQANQGFVHGMQDALYIAFTVTIMAMALAWWKLPNTIIQTKEEAL